MHVEKDPRAWAQRTFGECELGDQRRAPETKERRCDEVLEAVEWKVLWLSRENKARPDTPPSLRWAYESVAKLGGWIDTKRTGRAGWKALWEGWFILQQRVDGYHLAQQLNPQGKM